MRCFDVIYPAFAFPPSYLHIISCSIPLSSRCTYFLSNGHKLPVYIVLRAGPTGPKSDRGADSRFSLWLYNSILSLFRGGCHTSRGASVGGIPSSTGHRTDPSAPHSILFFQHLHEDTRISVVREYVKIATRISQHSVFTYTRLKSPLRRNPHVYRSEQIHSDTSVGLWGRSQEDTVTPAP